ncbi:phage holin family protein [Calidifontibacillus oryziterrae]|uniref:phage holin family protein n=1 Tax=Calidifontibacillus oryziterrae TaxID=1191699 RepID=UPI001E5C2867|nr:phage holin family protein [Calidifontibacillus oryziterrae]
MHEIVSQETVKLTLAASGSIITQLFGGFDRLFTVLIFLVIIDYITGLIASGIAGELSSRVGFKGIAKKLMIFSLVAVAHIIDQLVDGNHLIRDATIYFYIVNEIISIIENAGRVGIPIPNILKKAVSVFRNKAK